MSSYEPGNDEAQPHNAGQLPEAVLLGVVPGPPMRRLPVARVLRRRRWLPAGLFVATCLTTLLAGGIPQAVFSAEKALQADLSPQGLVWAAGELLKFLYYHAVGPGWKYSLSLMTILVCHEAGHFLQARRHGVWASYPHFIPVPLPPIGTFGAVIAMEPRMGNRRALFDIGITGPLAGLVPTIAFCILGLYWSEYRVGRDQFGDPILMQWLAHWLLGPMPPGQAIKIHPVGFAGWVGLLITALNLLPIGQLDGGHVLYALLRDKARYVASMLLMLLAAAVVIAALKYAYPAWVLMLVLLLIMGPVHPPTGDDNVSLGPARILLGWLILAFVPIGLTPTPIIIAP